MSRVPLTTLWEPVYHSVMQLSQWVKREGRGAITRICRESGVAYSTIYTAYRGQRIGRYATARAISDATGGEVTVDDLCAPLSGEAAE